MIDEQKAFPETFSDLSTPELMAVFEEAPSRFDQALVELDEEHLLAKPRSGKWSIAQVVVHVTDSEIMGAARIRQTLTQSIRDLVWYSQTSWCEILQYERGGEKRVRDSVDLFTHLRDSSAFLLRSASDGDWNKTALHPELGEVSLRNLLELYADHGERHLNQIIEMRGLLGIPLAWNRLLPRELY